MIDALLTTSIPGGELVSRGKVRDIYAHDDALVLVATDRISAFDCVLSPGVPGRGIILTRLSSFWFHQFSDLVPNHLLATELVDFPEPYRSHPELAGRSVLAKRLAADPGGVRGAGIHLRFRLEGVRRSGEVCGIALPDGSRRVGPTSGADLHPRDQGHRRP